MYPRRDRATGGQAQAILQKFRERVAAEGGDRSGDMRRYGHVEDARALLVTLWSA
jgi:hypothetical protein